ncbi:MAG: DUF2284 domain-containing protein [Desulfobacteraceae bacterium]
MIKVDLMQIEQLLAQNQIDEYRHISIDIIPIDPKLRKYCEQNACGSFGKNHMCPPAVKEIREWKQEIHSFEQAVLISKVYSTKSSFDLKAMHNGAVDFEKSLRNIKEAYEEQCPEKRIMLLGAGPCMFCKKCTYPDGLPCRFPDKPHPSVEACGINVVQLSQKVNMKYYNGKNTVTYFGMILF